MAQNSRSPRVGRIPELLVADMTVQRRGLDAGMAHELLDRGRWQCVANTVLRMAILYDHS